MNQLHPQASPKIVYIIFAHKNPDQLARLIHRLNTGTSSFFVHVNKSTDNITYAQMVNSVRDLRNVVFITRQYIHWGSIMFAVNDAINDVLNRKFEFDYVFLLTGQDYPIKTNTYIENFLCKNYGKEFIHYFPIPRKSRTREPRNPREAWSWQDEKGGLDRIENWHIRLFNNYYRIPGDGKSNSRIKSFIRHSLALLPKRKFVKGFKPFGGSTYWCLTKKCVEYMNSFINENPHVVNYFKYVGLPDEIFFQTLILNSPFKDSVVNDDLRCADWTNGGWHPRIWRKEDIEILNKHNGLIARKFDSSIDSEVLDLIDWQCNLYSVGSSLDGLASH